MSWVYFRFSPLDFLRFALPLPFPQVDGRLLREGWGFSLSCLFTGIVWALHTAVRAVLPHCHHRAHQDREEILPMVWSKSWRIMHPRMSFNYQHHIKASHRELRKRLCGRLWNGHRYLPSQTVGLLATPPIKKSISLFLIWAWLYDLLWHVYWQMWYK